VNDLPSVAVWQLKLQTYTQIRNAASINLTIFGLNGGLTLHSSNASQSILLLKNGWTRIARSPP